MSSSDLHVLALVLPTLAAGALMIRAGTQKKLLEWKSTPRRCPVCGRTDRHECH